MTKKANVLFFKMRMYGGKVDPTMKYIAQGRGTEHTTKSQPHGGARSVWNDSAWQADPAPRCTGSYGGDSNKSYMKRIMDTTTTLELSDGTMVTRHVPLGIFPLELFT